MRLGKPTKLNWQHYSEHIKLTKEVHYYFQTSVPWEYQQPKRVRCWQYCHGSVKFQELPSSHLTLPQLTTPKDLEAKKCNLKVHKYMVKTLNMTEEAFSLRTKVGVNLLMLSNRLRLTGCAD
jgi:hypothetical protein